MYSTAMRNSRVDSQHPTLRTRLLRVDCVARAYSISSAQVDTSKIATCIAAGDPGVCNGNLHIQATHIRIALRLLNKAEKLMHLAFRGTAFSKSSKDIDRILGYMIRESNKGNLPVKHSTLLKRNSHYLNGTEFKEVIKMAGVSTSLPRTVSKKSKPF